MGGVKEDGVMTNTYDWQERSRLLLGSQALEILRSSNIAVAGLGGVGAFAAEMLVRMGAGNLLIVDSDVVTKTNKNRQLLALDSTMGRAKCDVMAERLMDINSELNLVRINRYITPENVSEIFKGYDINYIVDAIDTLSPKLALIKYAVNSSIRLVSSMGAGAKYDGTKVVIRDLSKSYNCPLAYVIRKKLRKENISGGFNVVFSEELPVSEAIVAVEERNKKSMTGTVSYLPAIFGALCAQAVLTDLLAINTKK